MRGLDINQHSCSVQDLTLKFGYDGVHLYQSDRLQSLYQRTYAGFNSVANYFNSAKDCQNITVEGSVVSDHQRDWAHQYVPLVMMAYRSSVHDSINSSASMMMLGREIQLPIDLIFGSPDSERNEYAYGSLHAKELQDRLIEVHEFA